MSPVKPKLRILSIGLLLFFCASVRAESVTNTVSNAAKEAGNSILDYSKSVLFPASTQAELAKALGWVNDTSGDNEFCALCGGYYLEFPIPYIANPNVQNQTKNYDISAEHVEWSMKGTSTFSGNAKIIQPDRELTADLIKLRRNTETGKVEYIDAYGNIHIIEPGLLGLANTGTVNTTTKQVTLHQFVYRAGKKARTLVRNPKTGQLEYHIYSLNARGQATTAQQIQPHVFKLKNATYTACPPTSNTWKISGTTVNLNYNTGWGSATNALLYIKNVPVFYFPYYTFPINRERKTGFLTPSISYDNQNGLTLTTPFYWNMAPNYDYTLTPDFMIKRGVLLSNTFRYLSPTTTGSINYQVIPHDQIFEDLQRKMRGQAPTTGQTTKQLDELRDDSDTRQSLSLVSQSQYNANWSSGLNYNYMTDAYFQNDFTNDANGTNNQLLQNANINYASNYWGVGALLQRYQTLQPIGSVAASEQYRQLPTIDFNSHTPTTLDGLSANTNGAYTDFTIDSNAPVGQRIYLNPDASWSLSKPFGSITPEISAHLIQDNLGHEAVGTTQDPGATIPTYSLTGDLNFYRNYHLFGKGFKQTLQPKLMYLYTPYRNQTDLPIFDTDAQPLSYSTMFRRNRFSGADRVGDANQITAGITSSFLSRATGQQDIQAGIATIYYFEDRAVDATCYGATCSTSPAKNSAATQNFSPIAGQLNLSFSPNWNIEGDWAWSFRQAATASASLAFHYQADDQHIINLGYYDVNDAISGITNSSDHPTLDSNTVQPAQDLQQAIISSAWKLTPHWTFLGAVDRNWAQNQTADNPKIDMYDTFLSGFQYDSCCWAMRVVAYRRYVDLQSNGRPRFDNGVFYQFELKGLAAAHVGSYQAPLLDNDISGFQDQFGTQSLTQGLTQ